MATAGTTLGICPHRSLGGAWPCWLWVRGPTWLHRRGLGDGGERDLNPPPHVPSVPTGITLLLLFVLLGVFLVGLGLFPEG